MSAVAELWAARRAEVDAAADDFDKLQELRNLYARLTADYLVGHRTSRDAALARQCAALYVRADAALHALVRPPANITAQLE